MEKVESLDKDVTSNFSSETDTVSEPENVVFKAPPIHQQLKAPSRETSEKLSFDVSKCYKPPKWAQTCPSESNYFIEVIKNGTLLSDDTIQLSGLDHCILGRQPGPILSPKSATGRTSTLLHPSISRGHAVLQYGCSSNSPPGWYIFDFDSTHGTFVNKQRVPPGRYIRLRVGYVLRFGSSTRLLILNGPEDDMEEESKETWSELVAKKKAKMAIMDGGERELRGFAEEASIGSDCNWGISDDEEGDSGENMLQLLANSGNCLSHEKNYIEDPKKALMAFFDREGIDPYPEYEFVEGRLGQQICRIELPLEEGTIYAEVPLIGRKKKEAAAACALEACRMLDRLGQFDANKGLSISCYSFSRSGKIDIMGSFLFHQKEQKAVRRAREKAYWRENDYYSSDEDTFLDRTGQIEIRRRKRMRRFGIDNESIKENDSASKVADEGEQDLFTLLARLEDIGKEMIEVEDELSAAERALEAAGENANEMDELEAYMEAIKNGAPKRAERQALKRRLVTLRQEEVRLLRRAGIPNVSARFSTSAFSAASAAVRATLAASYNNTNKSVHAESKLNALKRQLPKVLSERVTHKKDVENDEAFVPEVDEDEESDIKQDSSKSIEDYEEINEIKSTQKRSSISKSDLEPTEQKSKRHQNANSPITQTIEDCSRSLVPSKVLESGNNGTDSNVKSKKSPQLSLPRAEIVKVAENEEKTRRLVNFPSPLPAPIIFQKVVEEPDPMATYDDNIGDPNFALWVPPQNQTGDGMTELNAKYGY